MLRIALTLMLTAMATAAYAETYRLVHAIGNAERIVAKGLSKPDCEVMKKERLSVAKALGAGGSITCLPESFFND